MQNTRGCADDDSLDEAEWYGVVFAWPKNRSFDCI